MTEWQFYILQFSETNSYYQRNFFCPTEKEKKMTVKFMEQRPLDPKLMTCPHCQESDRIGIHSHKECRDTCQSCGRTFAQTTGTIF